MDFDVINACVLEIKKDKDVLRGLNDYIPSDQI
jgi:hypothetical protein